jgi:hypothetical protein
MRGETHAKPRVDNSQLKAFNLYLISHDNNKQVLFIILLINILLLDENAKYLYFSPLIFSILYLFDI